MYNNRAIRVICAIISIILLFGYSFAENETKEINFLNIPWLSNETEVFEQLTELGYVSQGLIGDYTNDRCLFLVKNDDELIWPASSNVYSDVCFTVELGNATRGKIAGYIVKNMSFTFANDGAFHLISVSVELVEAKYEDVKEKLTRVYGESEHIKTEEFAQSSIWKDGNDAAVVLYTDSEGYDYTLMYGRTDAEQILQNCLSPVDLEDVSGL